MSKNSRTKIIFTYSNVEFNYRIIKHKLCLCSNYIKMIEKISTHFWLLIAVRRNNPMNEAIKLTNVSCALSLDETSAKFPRIAWCCVKADRVAPPATPTIAFIKVVAHNIYVAICLNFGRINISIPMATSLSTSALSRHFLESRSSSVL